MPTAKVKAKAPAKAPAKKTALKAVKKTATKPLKKAAKTIAKAPSKKPAAKAPPKLTLVAKPVAKVTPAPKMQTKAPLQKKETFFERLIREKAERHANFQKQNEHHHGQQNDAMPTNHAKFSKFAGPRRRAS